MSATRQFFYMVFILIAFFVIYALSSSMIVALGKWMGNTNWIYAVLVGIALTLATRFLSPLIGTGLSMVYDNIEAKFFINFTKFMTFTYYFTSALFILGLVIGIFKYFSFSGLMTAFFLFAWVGNITWYTSRFVWDRQKSR